MKTAQSPSLNTRLDSLRFTRLHGRLLTGAGIGWAMDAMDVGLMSFVVVRLAQVWELTNQQRSVILSMGFAGMAVGASVGGLLADRFGRRQIFALTLLVYGLATGASALAQSVAILVALRFVVGLGLGAELPVASTLVSEFSPPRIRGRMVVWLEAFWAVGWTLAALIGFYVVPNGDTGWRWALAIGAVPAVYAVWVRRDLPESVRFLLSRGKVKAAERIVERFERSAGAGHRTPVTDLLPVAEVEAKAPRVRLAALWSDGMAKRTTAIWLVWFCVNFSYYGAFTWLPSLLVADGFTITQSLRYTLIITLAQLPGYACSAFAIEKWGRRVTLAVFLVGSAAAAGVFAQVGTPGAIIAAGMMLSFFILGAWGALYAVTPEIYPTALRGTGAGWAAGFGRIASILAPLTPPFVLAHAGTGTLFALFAAVFAIGAAGALLLPEMKGKVLAD
jgi:putative MFS transporter